MSAIHAPQDNGPPVEILIYATPHGWRHSTVTKRRALICGNLRADADTGSEQAKRAAELQISTVGTEFFQIALGINWASNADDSWTGTVFRLDGQPM